MGVSLNGGTPKSSILIGFSIINHPFWDTPSFGNTHMFYLPTHFVDFNYCEWYQSDGSPMGCKKTCNPCLVNMQPFRVGEWVNGLEDFSNIV